MPLLPVTAPLIPSRPPLVVRGSIAIWNIVVSLLATFIALFASLFSTAAGLFECLSASVNGFQIVLSSNVTNPSPNGVTPESPESPTSIPVPSPVFNPADPQSPPILTGRRARPSIVPTYVPQPHSDIGSSQQIAMALQIVTDVLVRGQSTTSAFKWLLADRVPVGYVWMPASLAAVLATRRHLCDVALDREQYAHLVWGDADPALYMTPPPRVEVSFPSPIRLDISPNASQTEIDSIRGYIRPPFDSNAHIPVNLTQELSVAIESQTSLTQPTPMAPTHSKPARGFAAICGVPAGVSLDTSAINQSEEDFSTDRPAVSPLPLFEPDNSMDTSLSNVSMLPTPVNSNHLAHASQLNTPAAREVVSAPGSPLSELPCLPSSLSALLDNWNPPATFSYVNQSPIQGVTCPIISHQPVQQPLVGNSPSIHSLPNITSSFSLFANEWTPPIGFKYEHPSPPVDGTRPIIPLNNHNSLGVRPGNVALFL